MCDKYFNKVGNDFRETDLPKVQNEIYYANNLEMHDYQGIPTSIVYRPKWLKWLDKILGK